MCDIGHISARMAALLSANPLLQNQAFMTTHSRLGGQIEEATAALARLDASWALIGGLALAPHNVVRSTQDVDLLVAGDRADVIDAELLRLGYRCIHRSSDAGNYLRGDQRLDLLYARRPAARRILAEAREVETSFGNLRVISAEGLIAFKLQAVVNDPGRTRDLDDIRALLTHNRSTLDLAEVREYFRLFNREHLLDEFLAQIRPG